MSYVAISERLHVSFLEIPFILFALQLKVIKSSAAVGQ